MHTYQLAELKDRRGADGGLYLEFIRSHALSVGIYQLSAGARDPQLPHSEDEVYYVTGGAGQIDVAGESRPVRPGSVIYVPAQAEHRFHSITEDLTTLVFFAPAEGANAPSGGSFAA
jgi:mannose-6-phosphate isomerase-like protein (cupin superfamily)